MKEYTVKVDEFGGTEWFLNGQRHREDGPAIKFNNGTECWYLNGKRHRTDGPAAEWADGTNCWFQNDQLHREDGPAIELADGTKRWFINGEEYTEVEFAARTKTKELTVADIEKLLGYKVKIVKS